jgi:hypothetical protein
MGQFSLNKDIITVNVLNNNDIDMFKKFKEHNKNALTQYNRCTVKQIGGLNDFEKKLLVGNEFNYLRPIVSKVLFHINLMNSCKSKNMLFLKDTIRLHDNFGDVLNGYLNSDYDIIMMGSDKLDLDNCYGYLVSRMGISKIMDHVNNNGIKNMNYLDGIDVRVGVFDMVYDVDYVDGNNENDDKIDKNIYKKFDGYKFYCLMDSYGNDLGYVGSKSVEDLIYETDKLGGKAFNTLGYIKSGVTVEDQFINLPNSVGNHCGLYVKI